MAGRLDRGILTTLRLPVRLEAALTKHTVANLRAQRRPAADAAPTVDDLVATQMDRSYATAHRVMREARHRLPSYTPLRMLDFGASQSPMAWAAQASWPDVPLQVCAVEPNAALRQDGEQLCAAASTVPFHVHAPHWSEPIPGVHYDNRDDRDAKRYDARRARRRARDASDSRGGAGTDFDRQYDDADLDAEDGDRQYDDDDDDDDLRLDGLRLDEDEEEERPFEDAVDVPVPQIRWQEKLPTHEEQVGH